MKQYTLITLFSLFFAQAVSANDFVVSNKGINDESKFCISAVKGEQTISEIATALGINERNIDRRIQCNGIGISTFIEEFVGQQVTTTDESSKQRDFMLVANHADRSAQLCVIAASGDFEKLHRTVHSYNMNMRYFVKYNMCNGLSVVDFAKKYGNKQTASNLSNFM